MRLADVALMIRSNGASGSIASNAAPLTCAEVGELACELDGTLGRAIGDDERRRLQLEQRPQRAARSPARTQQQDPRRCETHAEILREVGDEAHAVGVVTDQFAVTTRDRVHRIRALRARSQFVDEIRRDALVRQRDVGAAAALLEEEVEHVVTELLGRRLLQTIRSCPARSAAQTSHE